MRFVAVSSAVAAFAGVLGGAALSPARGTEISDRCGTFVVPNDILVFAAKAISNHRALLSGAKTMSQLSSEEVAELNALVVSFQEVVHPVLSEEAEVVEALAIPRRTGWILIRMRL